MLVKRFGHPAFCILNIDCVIVFMGVARSVWEPTQGALREKTTSGNCSPIYQHNKFPHLFFSGATAKWVNPVYAR